MDISSIKDHFEGLTNEEAWEWFWSLFKFDFSKTSLKVEDFQHLHAFLINKYKKDPTVSKKYVNEIEISTGFTISLGGTIDEKPRLLKRSDSVYEYRPKTFRNSIQIEVDED